MFEGKGNYVPVKAIRQRWIQTEYSFMEKPRPDYGLMLVLCGQIEFISESILCAEAGNLIFLPKNSRYKVRFHIESGKVENYLINFETDMNFEVGEPTLVAENTSFSCTELFKEFVEKNYGNTYLSLHSRGLFYLLLDSVEKQKKTEKSDFNKVFEKAKKLLESTENIPISKIARECSVSESGLRKIFVDNAGISPARYRINEKIKNAKYLLESTDMTVGEISDKLNFYDTAYFCRMFSRYTGVTPKRYSGNKRI